jgi:hypothetical protein
VSRWKVLYRRRPSWLTGENEPDRDTRVRLSPFTALAPDLAHYPGDYAGFVVSVVPAEGPAAKDFSPGELVDPNRAVVELDLTDEGLAALRSRRSRIGVDRRPSVVTFDQKHGAIAAALKERYPLDFLVREQEELDEIAAVEERNQEATVAWQLEVDTWRVGLDEAVAIGAVLETPAPAPPVLEPVPEREFERSALRLTKALPPNVTHSGAGLYKVDGSGITHNDTIAGFRENQFIYSDQLENAAWDAAFGIDNVRTADVAADPDGEMTAERLAEGAGTDNHVTSQTTSWDGSSSYIMAGSFKADGRTKCQLRLPTNGFAFGPPKATFDLTTGTVDSHSDTDARGIEAEPGGWYRCWIVATSDAAVSTPASVLIIDDAGNESYAGDTAKGIFACKMEVGVGTALWDHISTRATSMHAVLLTTGGLTEDERNGEVLVSGGNDYPVIKVYPSQANVVGDPTGEAGALTISPYTTIQSALDQLWTDQGGAKYTEIQYIRIFADTYTEDCTANAGFVMDAQNGYYLVIEGDPADDRANIIIQPPGADTYAIMVSDEAEIRHLTIDGVNLDGAWEYGIRLAGGYLARVRDCAITVTYGFCVHSGCSTMHLEDCVLQMNGNRKCIESSYETVARRCTFIGNAGNKTQSTGFSTARGSLRAEACTFRDCLQAVVWCATAADYDIGHLDVRNCSFYNCGQAVRVNSRPSHVLYANLINNAFKDVDYIIRTQVWPDEATEGGIHGPWTLRNNCFEYDTAFAYNDSVTKTLAQFAAFDAVDSSGNLDATDPLFTDPANGDFSLQTVSPCWDTGHSAGVTHDVAGVAMDGYHPPIGAKAVALVKTPPTMSVASVSDTLTITLTGGSHRYRVRLETDAGVEEAESSRAGAGDVVFASVAAGFHRIVGWAVTADDATALGEPSAVERAWSPGTLVTAAPGVSAAVSGQTVTVTLTGSAYRYRVRLETDAGVQETEVSRSGAGDIVFGSVAYGSHIVTAWSVDESDLPLGEHSTTTADVLVIPDATQTWEAIANKIRGRFKTEVADDAPWGEILAKTTVSASATDNSFNDGTEDLSVFVPRQQILVSGFTESANNGYFTVVSATANKLVVSGGTLVTEAAGDAVTIKSTLPTQYDNDGSFERPESAPWCRFTILQGDTAQVTAGGSKRFRQPGVAIAQVFVPAGEGDKRALELADAIKLAFRSVTAAGVIYRSPSVQNMGRRDGEWQVNVSCPFFADDLV